MRCPLLLYCKNDERILAPDATHSRPCVPLNPGSGGERPIEIGAEVPDSRIKFETTDTNGYAGTGGRGKRSKGPLHKYPLRKQMLKP